MLKLCVVVLSTFFRVAWLSSDVFSLYNISVVPPLGCICGLNQEQMAAATRKRKCMDEVVVCSSIDCIDKQQELVECLTYQEVSKKRLYDQLGLEVHSLDLQLKSDTNAKEWLVSEVFNVNKQLNKALGHFYEMVRAYEAVAVERAKARNVVQESKACVEKIDRDLCRARDRLKVQRRLDSMEAFKKNPLSIPVTDCQCTDCPPHDDGRCDSCPNRPV